jgi:5-methylcytosine-specific restriction endonuclease McrA
MKIKIDPVDKLFSDYIRMRDGYRCQRCNTYFPEEKRGGLHCSHYFGRGRENTRFDPENCDALCFGCHRIWGSEDKEGYRTFKIKQLGENGFNALQVRAEAFKKRNQRGFQRKRIKILIEELKE